jgi:hypothetical protein
MDKYCVSQFMLPLHLYRVQYSGTQTIYDHKMGLMAQDSTPVYNDDSEFRESIVQAFTWSSSKPSPYIALFSEKDHAENWALSWSSQRNGERQVITINTRQLRGIYVFKLSTLVENLNIVLPHGASQHRKGAYLCLHRIPSQAISAIESGWDIQSSKFTTPWIWSIQVRSNIFCKGGNNYSGLAKGTWITVLRDPALTGAASSVANMIPTKK